MLILALLSPPHYSLTNSRTSFIDMELPPPPYSQVKPSNTLSVKFTKGQLLMLSEDAFKEIAQQATETAKALDDINAKSQDLRSNKKWQAALRDWDMIRHVRSPRIFASLF